MSGVTDDVVVGKREELETFEQHDDYIDFMPPKDVFTFQEQRTCADIFRLLDKGLLDLKPGFQRDFVWSVAQQTHFVDSLAKGLPIPNMCFAQDTSRTTYTVVDGVQRISTIKRILDPSENWNFSNAHDVDRKLRGKSVADFRQLSLPIFGKRSIFDLVEEQQLPITVIVCDLTKPDHQEYMFTIFHRLNRGGEKLSNQEIRNCIFGGEFNELLNRLDKYPNWRALNRLEEGNNYRWRYQEIILRFFAFSEDIQRYKGSLSQFLNQYMKEMSGRNTKTDLDKSEQSIEKREEHFCRTVDLIFDKIFSGKVKKRLPISVLESTLVAVGKNLETLSGLDAQSIQAIYEKMKNQPEFSSQNLGRDLASVDKVLKRFKSATRVFAEV